MKDLTQNYQNKTSFKVVFFEKFIKMFIIHFLLYFTFLYPISGAVYDSNAHENRIYIYIKTENIFNHVIKSVIKKKLSIEVEER